MQRALPLGRDIGGIVSFFFDSEGRRFESVRARQFALSGHYQCSGSISDGSNTIEVERSAGSNVGAARTECT